MGFGLVTGRRAAMVALLVLCAGAAFAAPVKKFASAEFGYSVAYPEKWYFHEGGKQVDLFTAEDAFDSEDEGAGLTILVDTLEKEDEGQVDKAMERIAKTAESGVTLGEATTRGLGSREWRVVAITDDEHNIEGEIFGLVKGVTVYVIGSFYKRPDSRSQFQPAVDAILASFRFAPVVYRTFQNKAKGLSFSVPQGREVADHSEEVAVVLAGENVDGNGYGAAISLGAFSATDEEFKGLDEKGVFKHLEELFEEGSTFVEPKVVTLAKTSWYRGEVVHDGGKMAIYIKKVGAYFFGVVLIVRPVETESEFQPLFDTFLKSLAVDFKKWAASLDKAKK
jgi:hypothetical protein